MKIKTKYLGEVDIDKKEIINFPKGLLGFKDHKEFILLNIKGNPYFKFLQDIHNEYIAFLLINPWDFLEDYDIKLPENKLKNIGISSREGRMEIYSIVTIGKSLEESTSNLLAPVVINLENKKGKQFILENSPYKTRHKLFLEGEETC